VVEKTVTLLLVTRFHDIFREIGDTEDAQIVILTSMYNVWRSHQQVNVTVVLT